MDENIGGSCSVQPQYISLRENPSTSESSSPHSVAEKQDVVRQNQNQNQDQTTSNRILLEKTEETTKRGKDLWISVLLPPPST